MQDIRWRTAAAILLCIGAFASIPAAAAAFVWWLLFARPFSRAGTIHLIIPGAILVSAFSLFSALAGGDAVSYFIRMMVIILIGFWMYADLNDGEFLQLGVWLLGDRAGFELGMLADMAMQTLVLLVRDFDRIRVAAMLKRITPGYKALVPAGLVLVSGALSRAGQTTELLAVRGYRNGGTLCPAFVTTRTDRIAGLCALCVLIIAIIPVSEFFILYR
jgi:energy-coupling factor transport system permease protein